MRFAQRPPWDVQVPADMAPRDLAVTFEPFGVRVGHRRGGEAFLEGRLERGIVPAECVWMAGGGAGEDGCLLLLRKMNLELLRRWRSPALLVDPPALVVINGGRISSTEVIDGARALGMCIEVLHEVQR